MVDCGGVLKEESDIYRIPSNTTHLGLYQNEFQNLPNWEFSQDAKPCLPGSVI